MFEILPQSAGNALGVKVSGKLLHEDYQGFLPKLEALIQQHGTARCLIELIDMKGIELRALWDELKFDMKHCQDIERCAVIGDKAWEKWATNLSKPMFPKANIRYFEVHEVDKAWEFVKAST